MVLNDKFFLKKISTVFLCDLTPFFGLLDCDCILSKTKNKIHIITKHKDLENWVKKQFLLTNHSKIVKTHKKTTTWYEAYKNQQ